MVWKNTTLLSIFLLTYSFYNIVLSRRLSAVDATEAKRAWQKNVMCSIANGGLLLLLLSPQGYIAFICLKVRGKHSASSLRIRQGDFCINLLCILVHICNLTKLVQRRIRSDGIVLLNFSWSFLQFFSAKAHHGIQRVIFWCALLLLLGQYFQLWACLRHWEFQIISLEGNLWCA